MGLMDQPARILIVDDEPLNVDYLEQELEAHGFQTESAGNGLEALEQIAVDPPDLVLMDVMMPELDGISALRILKQDPDTKLIPIVVMTALNAVEDRVRGIEAGADDFLSKPVDERELLARIKTALTVKRSIDETVGALQRTSDHLERFGAQMREVAILAIDWLPCDDHLPIGAVRFLGRGQREAAEQQIEGFGGTAIEGRGQLVAVFAGGDLRRASLAAVEAALAVRATAGSARIATNAAVATGTALIGSVRSAGQWAYGASGDPVDQATRLAREGKGNGDVRVTSEAAVLLSERFRLRPVEGSAFEVQTEIALAEETERRIATILITDIANSTPTIESAGDRAGGELLAAYERMIREELIVNGGVEIDMAGDGVLASFDSAARAVSCALAVLRRSVGLGLRVRAGIHTGEIEQIDGRPRGLALHIASRIASHARPDEILVSATTRDLATGAELIFVERGEHLLKGVSEPRLLFAALAEEPASSSPAKPDRRLRQPASLTAREIEVLRLVTIGLSDAEVAGRLVVSVRTINSHLRAIYRKLGVRSRGAAARRAEQSGLLG